MYKFDFTGKVCFITGGAEGLGKEYVQTMAEQGADVAFCDVKDEEGKATEKEIAELTGKKIKFYHCDVTDEEQVHNTVAAIVEEFGKIDQLINNAGILTYGPIATYSKAEFERMIAVDVVGPWLVSREVMNQSMIPNKKGRIVNISSVAAEFGTNAGCPAYHAGKGAILGLIKGQACEYPQYGDILVNGVGPGTILNGTMTSRSKVASNPETHRNGRNPLKRAGEFGEMSGIIIYFLSDECTYTNGQNIYVDGGYTSALN